MTDLPGRIKQAINQAQASAAVVLTANEDSPEALACASQVFRAAEVDRQELADAVLILDTPALRGSTHALARRQIVGIGCRYGLTADE